MRSTSLHRKHIILLGIILVILFNVFLTYILMLNPYLLYFNRPELSEIPHDTRSNSAVFLTIIHFVLLWGSVIGALLTWKRKNNFTLITPLFSGLTFWILMGVQEYYPDSNSQWTENGYEFKTQQWYLDGKNVYKRWKSRDSLNSYDKYQEIIWELDSINNK